jgi:serine O-acetyltransferase
VVGAGAKILGPFTVEDNARIGSNAVVLEPVPAGATVVGVPGKIVRCRDQNLQCLELVKEKAEEMKRQTFDAYAVAGEIDDPMESAVETLRQEVAQLRAELDRLNEKSDVRTG